MQYFIVFPSYIFEFLFKSSLVHLSDDSHVLIAKGSFLIMTFSHAQHESFSNLSGSLQQGLGSLIYQRKQTAHDENAIELPTLAAFAHEPRTSSAPEDLNTPTSAPPPYSTLCYPGDQGKKRSGQSSTKGPIQPHSVTAAIARQGPTLPGLGARHSSRDSLFQHTQRMRETSPRPRSSISLPEAPKPQIIVPNQTNSLFLSSQNLGLPAAPYPISLIRSRHKRSQPTQSTFVHRNQLSISSHMGMFSFNNPLRESPETLLTYNSRLPMTLLHDPQLQANSSVIPSESAMLSRQQSITTQVGAATTAAPHDEAFHAILSDMLKLDAFNLNTFLLSLLHRVDSNSPLDDFYNILYNPKSEDYQLQSSADKIDKTIPNDDLAAAMAIIERVLEVIRSPETLYSHFPALNGAELKTSSVNLHELLRSLLAIKILRHSLVEAEDADRHSERSPIPRLDIYKLYYILCQKLILKYPSSSNSTSLQQKLIFGQSKLGKLIKLVYPDLVSKRLGRRGESKYNYLGIRWNSNVVSDEIKALFNSDLNELTDLFRPLKKVVGPAQNKQGVRRSQTSTKLPQSKRQKGLGLSDMIFVIKAQGTFVEPNHFYPEGPFTLKAFLDEQLNENVEQSWFASTLSTSSDALSGAGVSSEEIDDFLLGEEASSTEENDTLLRGIVDVILPKLLASPDQPKIYLHLFMVICLKVFPYLLLLKKPLYTDTTKRLTSRVSHVIKQIEGEMSPLVSQRMQQQDIKNFLGILSRMIHLNQLLAAFFKADLQDYVLKEMQEDVTRVATEGLKDGLNETYRLITEACTSVLLACRYRPQFRGVPVTSNVRQFLFEACHTIEQMVSHDLALFVTNVMEGWLPQTEESFHGALKFRLLLATLKLVDEGVLNEDTKARFPALVIRGLYSRIAIQILQFTYRAHASMLGGKTMTPANPTFRLWYVLVCFIQEYLDVLAEINSLHLKAIE